MSSRAQQALVRATRERKTLLGAAEEHKAEIAAGALGTVAVAGAAAAGKAGLGWLRDDGDQRPSPAYPLESKEKPRPGIRRITRGRSADALQQLVPGEDSVAHEAP